MTHFTEARNNALDVIRLDLKLRSQVKRACLIWDVRGKLRFLFEGKDEEDLDAMKQIVSAAFKRAVGAFWSDQIWIWSEHTTSAEKAVYDTAWQLAIPPDPNDEAIRILDRHISKTAWFTPSLTQPWPLNEHTPAILSFFSFKGGVGRTTALIALAIQLARLGKKAAVIDLDLEAPGLSSILIGNEKRGADYGVVDYLIERALLEPREMDLADYYYLIDDPAIIENGPPITVVPAGNLDENYLEKLARIDYEALYHPSDQQRNSVLPLLELLQDIRRQREVDYLLLDARAGLHDLGGLALSGVAHLDVVFGLDSEQSWRGMEVVVRFLGRDRIKQKQNQLYGSIVFALAPEPGEKRGEAVQNFLTRSYQLFSDHYYDEADADPDEAMPLPAMDDSTQPHYPIVLGFDPLVQRYNQLRDIADRLTTGDFKSFAKLILERIGRII